ncbi:MAG: hypothetical protein LBQ05_00995 [Christensenellaceae bacterium]|jgi:hypothetical protein|nr:hypothetical protein [Christensenellaceae bacterium]
MEKITNDMFDISGRLREIDPEYQIYRNNEDGTGGRFELWWRGRFSLVIPFDCLDERTLDYTRRTRRENADEIAQEIDDTNNEIENEKQMNIKKMQIELKDRLLFEALKG